jgi:hypothetical protein
MIVTVRGKCKNYTPEVARNKGIERETERKKERGSGDLGTG